MQQKVPFVRIRLLDAVAAKQKAPFAACGVRLAHVI